MSTYEPEKTGNYYLLGDSHTEMVHLIDDDRYFNKSMGGLLPEQPEAVLLELHDVLDIACGPGGWVLGLAKEFPDVQFTGLDISQEMINYAQTMARASKLNNAHFLVGNAMEPLPFTNGVFDLVNARQLEGVIPIASWPSLLNEMVRVCRPGGIIRLTGNDWGVSNSSAFETFLESTLQSEIVFGLNHAPDARRDGVVNMLSRYLRDAGCVNVQERPSFMDISTGAEQHQDGYNLWRIMVELMEPFLLKAGVTTAPAYEKLKAQVLIQMSEENFRGIVYTMTAWGQKPA